MVSIEEARALLIQKLLLNHLPTFQEFLDSLSTGEKNAFTQFMITQPNKGANLVETRIRQLAESKTAVYVDAQIAAGSLSIDDIVMLFD